MTDFQKILMMAIGFGGGVLAMRMLLSPKNSQKNINMDTVGNILQADEFYKNTQKENSKSEYFNGTINSNNKREDFGIFLNLH